MLVRKTKEQKILLLTLKNEIKDGIFNFRKRYTLFPWAEVNKISKIDLRSDMPISVQGNEYTVHELVKEIKKIKNKLQSQLKPAFYNYILKAYIKDSMNQTGNSLKSAYTTYHKELQTAFKRMNEDLRFCLDGLKALNKALKTKAVKESVNSGNFVSESSLPHDNIDSIIFDFGSVLIKNTSGIDGYKIYNNKWKRDNMTEADLRIIFSTYYDSIHDGTHEILSLKDSKKVYKMSLPERLQKYADEAYDVASTSKEIYDYTVPLLKYLKEMGYKLYYLSNWGRGSFELCQKKGVFDILKYFDGGIISYKVGLQKPHKEIYQLLISDYKLDPSHTLFFDDKKENVDAAKKLGIRGIVFKQDTVKDIMKLPHTNHYVKESANDDLNKKCFDDFCHYVKWCRMDDGRFVDIKPLKKYMIHHSKKGYDMLLLATIDSNDKDSKELVSLISDNVRYSKEKIEFHTCYLPGDMFIFVRIPELKEVKESEDIIMDNIFEDVLNEVEFTESDIDILRNMSDDVFTEKFATKASVKAAKDAYDAVDNKFMHFGASLNDVSHASNVYAAEVSKLSAQYTLAALVLSVSAGLALNAGMRKFLRERLNNYTKLHEDCIPFKEFEKNRYTLQEMNKKYGSKFDMPDKYEASTQAYVYTYKNKPAFGIVIGQMSISAVSSSSSGNTSSTQISGQKKVEMAIIDSKFKKYEDFYFANLSTVHAIAHPCLKRFFKVAKSEWSEAEKKAKAMKEKQEKAVKESTEDMLTIYEAYIESYEELDDLFTEGANKEYFEEISALRSDFRELKKEVNASIKAKDFKAAKATLKKMDKKIDLCVKNINTIKIDETTGSSVLGLTLTMLNYTIVIASSVVTIFAPIKSALAGIFAGIGGVAAGTSVADIIDEIKTLRKEAKESKTDDGAKKFNMFRAKCIGCTKILKNQIADYQRYIDKAEEKMKASKKEEKVVKESAEYKAKKLAIYEACNSGDITLEDREELLDQLNRQHVIQESMITEEPVLSNKEKYERVKAVLYEKCANGEITLEQREDMVLEAFNMIFEATQPVQPVQPAAKANNNMEKQTTDIAKNSEKDVQNAEKDFQSQLDASMKKVDTK